MTPLQREDRAVACMVAAAIAALVWFIGKTLIPLDHQEAAGLALSAAALAGIGWRFWLHSRAADDPGSVTPGTRRRLQKEGEER